MEPHLKNAADMPVTYSASGKLLLFGEFFVLKGSKCLAMPLQKGQYLQVEKEDTEDIRWECIDKDGRIWLYIIFSTDLEIKQTTDAPQAHIVRMLLLALKNRKKELFSSGLHFRFRLDFERRFGFGTSSTFLSLLSQWAEMDPYWLSENSFRTSGYDIAAATALSPFTYSIKERILSQFVLNKEITDYLLFVYSGNKQSTAERVQIFNENKVIPQEDLERMDQIVEKAAQSTSITEWETQMEVSENLLAPYVKMQPVKEKYFKEYPFAIKSLGAWGGDFLLATCRDREEAKAYFKSKEKTPVFFYEDLIKRHAENH